MRCFWLCSSGVCVSWLGGVPVAPLCPHFRPSESAWLPPAGNCVPLSCLLLGLFWLFDFFFFFPFLIFSRCRSCWQPMTAGKKKNQNTKEKEKNKAVPKAKDLNKAKATWQGMERMLLSWRLMESTSVCDSFSKRSAAGWESSVL